MEEWDVSKRQEKKQQQNCFRFYNELKCVVSFLFSFEVNHFGRMFVMMWFCCCYFFIRNSQAALVCRKFLINVTIVHNTVSLIVNVIESICKRARACICVCVYFFAFNGIIFFWTPSPKSCNVNFIRDEFRKSCKKKKKHNVKASNLFHYPKVMYTQKKIRFG